MMCAELAAVRVGVVHDDAGESCAITLVEMEVRESWSPPAGEGSGA
jgi:hypothetical protein